MKATNFRAWVAQPNTPETDKQKYVLHTVNYELDGKTIATEIMAECPIDAINWVKEDVDTRCTACDDTLNKEAVTLGRDVCFDCYTKTFAE
tara:strand:- start:218 stop:490 length:273 start_codon:yes stop_codon:yes gene_type:complete